MAPPFQENVESQLADKLARAAISSRKQGGQDVFFIEGWFAIDQANKIFGFDGWGMHTRSMDLIDSVHQEDKGRYFVTYSARVRVIAYDKEGDGVERDGTGWGSVYGKTIGEASELATKEAETDAMKRALRTFGNQFGNCLYDSNKAGVEARGAGSYREEKPATTKRDKYTRDPSPPPTNAPQSLGDETDKVDRDSYFVWQKAIHTHKDRIGEDDYYEVLKKFGISKSDQLAPEHDMSIEDRSRRMNAILAALKNAS